MNKDIELLNEKIKRIIKKYEDLKCCGNCKKNGTIDQGGKNNIVREENCRQGVLSDSSCKYCEEWEYDCLKTEDRQI